MAKRTYLPPKCGFSIQGNRVVTDGTIKGRITGTMMAGILGCSPWSSPFRVACRLLGLADEDIGDKPAVKAGRALERRVIDAAQELYDDLGLMFVPADEIYAKREGDHASWASDFDDEMFAGHVDGIVFDSGGSDYILEVKTSGNLDSWKDGVPEYYWWQVALYDRFITRTDRAYVVLGIGGEEGRRRPELWHGSKENTVMFDMPIDPAKVDEGLEKVAKWYSRYIAKGETPSPDPTDPADIELFEHLQSIADSEDVKAGLVDRIAGLDAMVKEREDEMEVLYETRDRLRGMVKDWMAAHDVKELRSADGRYVAVMGTQTRTYVDQSLMMADGIDPTPYIVEKVTNVFTVKPFKEDKEE